MAIDYVNHPPHYTQGRIECIDAMVLTFGPDRVRDYCLMNAFKYRWRAPFKGKQAEDLDKADWYLAKAKELGNE